MLVRRTGGGTSNNQNARSRSTSTELINKLQAMDVALEKISECSVPERQNVIQLVEPDAKDNVHPGRPNVCNTFAESMDDHQQEAPRITARTTGQHVIFEEEISAVRQRSEALRKELGTRIDHLQQHHIDAERRLQGQHETHRADTGGQIQQLLNCAKDLTHRLEAVEERFIKSQTRIDGLGTRVATIEKDCQSTASTAKAGTKECGEIMQKMTKQMASFCQKVHKLQDELQDRTKGTRTEMEQHVAKVIEELEQRLAKDSKESRESMERQMGSLQSDVRQHAQQLESAGDLSYMRGALRELQNAARRWPERCEEMQKRLAEESMKLQNMLDEKCLALHNEAARLSSSNREELTRRCDYEAGERGLWAERVESLQQNVREQFTAVKDRLEATVEQTSAEHNGHLAETKREMQVILDRQAVRSAELVDRVSVLELRCDSRSAEGGDGAAVADLRARLAALVERSEAERAEAQSTGDECRLTLKRLEASMVDRALVEQRLARRIEDLGARCESDKQCVSDDNIEAVLEERIAALEIHGESAAGDLAALRTRLDEVAKASESVSTRLDEVSYDASIAASAQKEIDSRMVAHEAEFRQRCLTLHEELTEQEATAIRALADALRLEISENSRSTQDVCHKACLEISDNVQKGLDEVRADVHWVKDEIRADIQSRILPSHTSAKNFADSADWRHVRCRIDSLERRLPELSREMRSDADQALVQIRSAERGLKALLASQAEDNAKAFRSIFALILGSSSSDCNSKPLAIHHN